MKKQKKITKISDIKRKQKNSGNSSYTQLYSELQFLYINNFLDKISKIKEMENNDFDNGFKLGLFCGEYQFYLEKVFDVEILDKTLNNEEQEFVNFFQKKELEYIGEITTFKTHSVNSIKKKYSL